MQQPRSGRARPSPGTLLESPSASLTDEMNQKKLEERTLQLNSVQRNYEVMSRMMQTKTKEMEQLRSQLNAEMAHRVSLGIKLEEMTRKADHAELQWSKLKVLPDQLATLQAELQRTRYDNSLALGKSSTLEEKMLGLSKMAEDTEFSNGKLKRELEMALIREAERKAEFADVRSEVERLRDDCKSLTADLKASQEYLSSATASGRKAEQQIALLNGRLESRDESISGLEANLRSLRVLLEEERTGRGGDRVALAASRGQVNQLESQVVSLRRSLSLAEEARVKAEEGLARITLELSQSIEEASQHKERCTHLASLVQSAEDRCTSILSQQVQADEVVMVLRVQLQQSKVLLADAQRTCQVSEETLRDSENRRRQEAEEASTQIREMHGRLANERSMRMEFIKAVIQKMEVSLERMSSLQSAVNQGFQTTSERHERMMSAVEHSHGVWERSLMEQEEVLQVMSSHVMALMGSAEGRAKKWKADIVVHHDLLATTNNSPSASSHPVILPSPTSKRKLEAALAAANEKMQGLQGQVSELRTNASELSESLAEEKRAATALKKALAQAENNHMEALNEAQRVAAEDLSAERKRLSNKLDALTAQVERLELTAKDSARATAEMREMEKAELQRQISSLQAEVAAERQRAFEAQQSVAETSGGQLAALSRMHQTEMESVRALGAAKAAELEASLSTARSNMTATWDSSKNLLSEMDMVARHLVKMGWDVKGVAEFGNNKHDNNGAASPLEGMAEDGSGLAVSKAVVQLRLHFSYITEAVQNNVAKAGQALAAAATAKQLQQFQAAAANTGSNAAMELLKGLKSSMARLLRAEEALAPTCTCMACMGTLEKPMLLSPCGHSVCERCLKQSKGLCVECPDGNGHVQAAIPNGPLEVICSKYEIKLSALRTIQAAVTAAAENI
ncbi:hypothetical protein CEUSTIGMA_g10712.t1 [Chlamydomonas eustigma]|uniref:RING-type domain-containing protein n=1 Tax=Chlamydomonas eustigma TaxID=1157962 RepID=A0A250XJU5_9CHLO|nr:hypothetical protein CEUSTIGMA_g10712.t1 [Chlamydomonas eustigma]|eukprot:GAX83286.1 hypothetical protein CEUSTIGMA_g10712.t1 [Chlamydomonas eustigma]